MLNNIIWDMHMKSIKPLDEMDDRSKYKKYEDFLKSLPERLNLQPKQEWSEEDKKKINGLYNAVILLRDLVHTGELKSTDRYKVENYYEELASWLKSLRLHPSWKPSEEQMEVLNEVIGDEIMEDTASCEAKAEVLKTLYADLQKLL